MWVTETVKAACRKIPLTGLKVRQKDYRAAGSFPVIDQGQELIGGYFDDESLLVPEEPPFIVFGDHTKVKKFVNFRFIAGADGIKVLKPHSRYVPKFFYYSLFVLKYPDKGYARHFQHVETAEIPCPPIDEQKQIVAKIEELFSELDAGVESLKKAKAQLKIYRQSVLKHAFEGRFSNTNVKEGELPDGWARTFLGDVIEEPTYGTSKKCSYEFEGTGVLRIPNIVGGVIDAADLKGAAFDEDEIEAYRLKKGDLLTIRSNGSVNIVGKAALVQEHDEKFLFAGYLIRLRPQPERINSRYLLHILNSHDLRNQIERKAKSTSGVNNINSKELKSLKFPICSLDEQQRIVAEIEGRLSVYDKMEEAIETAFRRVELLRQSILKRAFEGKLLS